MITYPLSLPTNIGMANITLSAENAVAISQSPFTFAQQVVKHPGERWRASVSLPPIKRVDAEPWIAFLLSLGGPTGTFLLNDPNAANPQGSAQATSYNLLTYTEDLRTTAEAGSTRPWALFNTTVTRTFTGPFGTSNSNRMTESSDVSALLHSRSYSYNFVSGRVYTLSAYYKVGNDSDRGANLSLPSTAFTTQFVINVNLSTGALVVTNCPTYSIVSVGSGWYRISMTATATATVSASFGIRSYSISAGSSTYTGNGTSYINVTGVQLEESASPSDYQGVYAVNSPAVNGGSQTGSTLALKNLNPNITNYLKAGDYIQISTGSGAKLHKVLTDTDTTDTGTATVDIWPSLRSSPADGTSVSFYNASGVFRLSNNVQQWDINNISSYGITFDCVEAL